MVAHRCRFARLGEATVASGETPAPSSFALATAPRIRRGGGRGAEYTGRSLLDSAKLHHRPPLYRALEDRGRDYRIFGKRQPQAPCTTLEPRPHLLLAFLVVRGPLSPACGGPPNTRTRMRRVPVACQSRTFSGGFLAVFSGYVEGLKPDVINDRFPHQLAGSGSMSGGGGIRTLETPNRRLTVFETAAFNHSATPPEWRF